MLYIIISNLLNNPSFEEWYNSNPLNWYKTGTTLSLIQESDTIYKGNFSCKVILEDTITLWMYQRMIAKPDSVYNFTVFILDNDPAGRVRLSLRFYLSDGSVTTQYSGNYSINSPFWQYLSFSNVVCPSNAESLEVQIRFYDSLPAWDGNAEFIIDNLYLCFPGIDTPKVVINEIHYNPSTSQGADNYFEFVEIFNPSFEDTYNLTNFQFTDGEGTIFSFPAIEIPSEEYIIIAARPESLYGEIEYLDDLLNGNDQIIGPWGGNIGLSNSGDDVILKNANGDLIDSITYQTSFPWPTSPNGNGPSLELIDWNANHNNGANWGGSNETYGTPGETNTVSNPAPTIGKINRFPFVPYGNEPETIKVRIIDNDSVLSAKFFYFLNGNDIDSITMEQQINDTFYCIISGQSNGTRLDSFFVKAIDNDSNVSYSDILRGFFWGIISIQDIRVNDVNGLCVYRGYDVRIQGTVTAAESVFAVNYLLFYIQDNTSGIACHDPDPTKIQSVNEDDSLEVIGTIVNFAGEMQLKYVGDYITYLGEGNPITPQTITIAQMGEAYEGTLVRIENVDTAYHSPWPSGVNTLDTIVDFSKALGLIWIDQDTDIDGWGPDWTINKNIVGILRQYDLSSPYTSGYEISPRRQTDFSDYLGSFMIVLNGYTDMNYVNLFWQALGGFNLFEIYLKRGNEFVKITETKERKVRLGPFEDNTYSFYVKGIKNIASCVSNIITLDIISLEEGIYDLSFKDILKFTFVSKKDKKIEVKIIDLSGRSIDFYDINVKTGKNIIPINIERLKKGLYFLYIFDGNKVYIQKFTLFL